MYGGDCVKLGEEGSRRVAAVMSGGRCAERRGDGCRHGVVEPVEEVIKFVCLLHCPPMTLVFVL